jgi:hypothetical protein
MSGWIEQSKHIENFKIDIAFMASDEFYFGGDNDAKQIEDEKYREKLYPPFGGGLITAKMAYERFDELVKYYDNVATLARKYDKKLEQYYFWVRPFLREAKSGEALVCFLWQDTFDVSSKSLESLTKENEGEILFDADQGWEIVAEKRGDRLYIKESDPDENVIMSIIDIDRNEAVKQINETINYAKIVIEKLVKRYGFDLWSTYIYPK